ncbi:hypothetical protein ABT144_14275 [Streptomyces sp. NPDC002039]|uniref:hypothetical protein n=1 Tax=Streptomyces sp. NPDC002039 TaxID=3154660 RepID=UPI003316FBB6
MATMLTGCGTHQLTAETKPGSTTVADPGRLALGDLPSAPTKGLAKGLVLPLAAYTVTPVDGYAWQASVQGQWRSCMARYGFEDFGPPAASELSVANEINTSMGRRYGVSDLDAVKKYGYHLPADVPEPPHWEPAAGAESAVFTGVGAEVEGGIYRGTKIPDGGCRGETKRMFPVPQTPEADGLSARIYNESRADAKVTTTVSKWVACMKVKGFDRKNPLDDLGDLGIQLSSPAVGEAEIAQAVADVECKQQTGLVAAWNARERDMQNVAIKSASKKLSEEKAAKDQKMAKVRQAYQAVSN